MSYRPDGKGDDKNWLAYTEALTIQAPMATRLQGVNRDQFVQARNLVMLTDTYRSVWTTCLEMSSGYRLETVKPSLQSALISRI